MYRLKRARRLKNKKINKLFIFILTNFNKNISLYDQTET